MSDIIADAISGIAASLADQLQDHVPIEGKICHVVIGVELKAGGTRIAQIQFPIKLTAWKERDLCGLITGLSMRIRTFLSNLQEIEKPLNEVGLTIALKNGP